MSHRLYGTVQQSGGFVSIASAVGKGTTIYLYFPKAKVGPNDIPATIAAGEAPFGDGERILVVEDNDKVREATVKSVGDTRLCCPPSEDRTRGDQTYNPVNLLPSCSVTS